MKGILLVIKLKEIYINMFTPIVKSKMNFNNVDLYYKRDDLLPFSFGGNSGGVLSIVASLLTFCLTLGDVLLDGVLADKPSMPDADAHQLIAMK